MRVELKVMEDVEKDVKVPWTLGDLELVLLPRGWWGRLKGMVTLHPAFFMAGFVLQGILVLALVFTLLLHGPVKKYVTLSSIGSEKTQIVVIFDGNVKEKEMRKVLLDLGATIVGGPSPQGMYRLSFTRSLSSKALEEVLIRLRREPGVQFAARYHGKR